MENWGVIYGENKYDYSIYSHACASISQVRYTFYKEECALADAIGVGIQPMKELTSSPRKCFGSGIHGQDYIIPSINKTISNTVPAHSPWKTVTSPKISPLVATSIMNLGRNSA